MARSCAARRASAQWSITLSRCEARNDGMAGIDVLTTPGDFCIFTQFDVF